jgi:hypothetical protein
VEHKRTGSPWGKVSSDFLFVVAVLAGWFALQAFVLPKFGVVT